MTFETYHAFVETSNPTRANVEKLLATQGVARNQITYVVVKKKKRGTTILIEKQ